MALAFANTLLWWLIDRSKVGFVLSAAVGLTGTVVLMGINPDMIPSPPAHLVYLSGSLNRAGFGFNDSAEDVPVAGEGPGTVAPFPLAGIASQEMVEMGIWTLSVLFCSCLCFGNIGRRLAWGESAGGKGRWAGVR